MWRLFNKLFGWDYVRTGNGKILRIDKPFINDDGFEVQFWGSHLEWLTCKPEKYLSKEKTHES